MALSAGTVVVSDDGAVIKSNAAGRLFDLLKANVETQTGIAYPVGDPESAKVLKGFASMANTIASWMVTEMTTYATAKIVSGTGGLQMTPNPNSAATACDGPSTDKFLTIV